MTSNSSLATAQLVIYIFLVLPVLFILFRHGRSGFLGWFYLFTFCTLRLIGGALSINNNGSSQTASIISSIGLSPLLLACDGILFEAVMCRRQSHRRNQSQDQNKMWYLVFLAFMHVLITIGLVLVAKGASTLASGNGDAANSDSSDALSHLKTGIVLLVLAWAFIIIGAALELHKRRMCANTVVEHAGTVLLTALIVSLVFLGITVWYNVSAYFTQKASLNPVTGSLAIRVVLGFIPDVIVVSIFVVAGLITHNVGRYRKSEERGERQRQNRQWAQQQHQPNWEMQDGTNDRGNDVSKTGLTGV